MVVPATCRKLDSKSPPAKGHSPTSSRRWTVGKTIRRTNAFDFDALQNYRSQAVVESNEDKMPLFPVMAGLQWFQGVG
jgi:hypothetical protein